MHSGHMKGTSCIKLFTVLSERPNISPKIETKFANFSVSPSIWRVCAYNKGSTRHTHQLRTKRQFQKKARLRESSTVKNQEEFPGYLGQR